MSTNPDPTVPGARRGIPCAVRLVVLTVLLGLCGLQAGIGATDADDLGSLQRQYRKPGAAAAERIRVVTQIAALASEDARRFLEGECLKARPRGCGYTPRGL